MSSPHDDVESQLDAEARALLRTLPEPVFGAAERVARRLARTRAAARVPPRRRVAPWAVGGSALAATTLLLVRFWSDPGSDEAPAGAGNLDSEHIWAARNLDGVDLTYRGAGAVAGTDRSPRIDWQRGTLNVEVTPGLGLDVRVQTREAQIRVVGTGFTVTRDALGTRVDVRHGVVETACGDEPAVRLVQGESASCAPTSAAGLLGRAQALQTAGAEPAAIADAVDRGLRLCTFADPVGAELGALQLQLLAEAGRTAEALETAHRLLEAGGGARTAEIVALAAALAAEAGGCEAAAPWLGERADARALCFPSPAPE
jgi:hypothetical protein